MHTHTLPFTFTLTFTGRAEGFFGEAAFDAAAFASRFGLGASSIGMYAGGEIGPQALADAPPSRATQVRDWPSDCSLIDEIGPLIAL
jgi:hypothetical protein